MGDARAPRTAAAEQHERSPSFSGSAHSSSVTATTSSPSRARAAPRRRCRRRRTSRRACAPARARAAPCARTAAPSARCSASDARSAACSLPALRPPSSAAICGDADARGVEEPGALGELDRRAGRGDRRAAAGRLEPAARDAVALDRDGDAHEVAARGAAGRAVRRRPRPRGRGRAGGAGGPRSARRAWTSSLDRGARRGARRQSLACRLACVACARRGPMVNVNEQRQTVRRSETWMSQLGDERLARRARCAAADPAPAHHRRGRAASRSPCCGTAEPHRSAPRRHPRARPRRRHLAGDPPADEPARLLGLAARRHVVDGVLAYTAYISRGSRQHKEIALTFDDGPGRQRRRSLRYLVANGVPATFFLVGSAIAKHPSLVRKQAEAGFTLGAHTETPRAPGGASPPAEQSRRRSSTPPIGSPASPGTAVQLLPPAVRLVRRAHARHPEGGADADGAVEPRPARLRRERSEPIVKATLAGARAGAIVLMHDGPGARPKTLKAVRRIVPALRRQGLSASSACRRSCATTRRRATSRCRAASRAERRPRVSGRRPRR